MFFSGWIKKNIQLTGFTTGCFWIFGFLAYVTHMVNHHSSCEVDCRGVMADITQIASTICLSRDDGIIYRADDLFLFLQLHGSTFMLQGCCDCSSCLIMNLTDISCTLDSKTEGGRHLKKFGPHYVQKVKSAACQAK